MIELFFLSSIQPFVDSDCDTDTDTDTDSDVICAYLRYLRLLRAMVRWNLCDLWAAMGWLR